MTEMGKRSANTEGNHPVFVYGDRLVISQGEMELGRRYEFEYLGVKMVAVRTGSCVDLYQVVGKGEE